MIILGIETSCDDTGIAVLKVKGRKNPCFKILSNVVSSQVKLHAKYGGVYPMLAKREHQKNLPVVLEKALKEAGNPKVAEASPHLPERSEGRSQRTSFSSPASPIPARREMNGVQRTTPRSALPRSAIDLIAVTVGPGLEPCLWVGVNFAKDLAKKLKKSLIPVDHMEGHIAANFIGGNSKNIFPAVCLAVSGGHTQLILMKKIGQYKILGETRDDASGECFDKTARILGLGYPGGPAIAAEAKKYGGRASVNLPRPMMYQKNYDFSFSGLKTAVLYHYRNQPAKVRKSKQYIQAMAAEIQQAIIDVLIHKTIKAAKEYKTKTIMLGGGVASNTELRKQLKEKIKKEILNSLFLIPDFKLCTDNAAMIAAAGYFRWIRGIREKPEKIEADANLRLAP